MKNWLLSIFPEIPSTVSGTTRSSLTALDHLICGNPLRVCVQRRKLADRKQKEEELAKRELTEEEQDVQMLSRTT